MSFGNIPRHHLSGPSSLTHARRSVFLPGLIAGLLGVSGAGAVGVGGAGSATAADLDRPIVLEVVHLEDRLAFQASCDVTDGLGTTRTSSFAGQTNSSVRFVGTGVACRLHSSDGGMVQVTLRNDETILAQAHGGASDGIMIAAR